MALPCLAAVCGSTYSKDLGFYANVNDVTDVSSFFNVNDAIRHPAGKPPTHDFCVLCVPLGALHPLKAHGPTRSRLSSVMICG